MVHLPVLFRKLLTVPLSVLALPFAAFVPLAVPLPTTFPVPLPLSFLVPLPLSFPVYFPVPFLKFTCTFPVFYCTYSRQLYL